MKVHELQEKILQLKKEKGICILAHAYQSEPILEIADYIGDSYGLSVQAANDTQENIIMCGVRFMAETCKVLSPQKHIFLPNPIAGCPMAEQLSPPELEILKQKYPGYSVVTYINTTAELKVLCDVCVTSSSAVQIIKALPEDKILFIPDANLGRYVAAQVPEKTLALWHGGCPRHACMNNRDISRAKERHPNALLLVHPECNSEVISAADYVGSTTGIMDYAKKSDAKEFIIGTEISIVEHLQYACGDKRFYPLSEHLTCPNMRITTLMDVYHCIQGTGGEEIILSDEVITGARRCIDRMIELGG